MTGKPSRKIVVEIADTGLGDPLTSPTLGKTTVLFVGNLAFLVTAMRELPDGCDMWKAVNS